MQKAPVHPSLDCRSNDPLDVGCKWSIRIQPPMENGGTSSLLFLLLLPISVLTNFFSLPSCVFFLPHLAPNTEHSKKAGALNSGGKVEF